METRANYIAVGFFTLVTLGVILALVYWFGRYGDTTNQVPLDVRIQGSVSGMGPGSSVTFNGINVGRVESLSLDSADPRFVIVHTKVNKAVPLREDTKASIGIRGLSGGAFLQLEGGSPKAAPLVTGREADVPVPQILGDPAVLDDLMKRVNKIAGQTERVMGTLEKFVLKNEDKASRTIENVEIFSKALAENSDGVGKFMQSAGDVAVSLQKLSDKLDGSLERVESILAAIDPESVGNTVRNVEVFTQSLSDQRSEIASILSTVNQAAVRLNEFSSRLGGTLDKVDGVVEAVSPETVRKVVNSIDRSTSRAEKVLAALDEVKIAKAVDDIAATTSGARELIGAVDKEAVRSLIADLSETTKNVSAVIAAVDATKVSETVENLSQAAQGAQKIVAAVDAEKINQTVDNISKAASDARGVVTDVSKVTSKFGQRGDDIDQMVTDATELAARLNASSKKVDGILDQVSALLGSDTTNGLAADARATLAEFRKAARTFSVQITSATAGINKFTGRGLAGTQDLIRDARQSINRIDRVIRNIESNPSALITGAGGSRVRETSGGRRRR